MKKLAVAAVAIAAALAVAVPSNAVTVVRVGDDFFRPGSVTVSKGATVRWRWVGDDPHNVTVRRGPVRFRSSTKSSGTYTKRLRRRGTYRLVCTVHPGMNMTLRVR